MEPTLTIFWRIFIITIYLCLLFFLNKEYIKNPKHFTKRVLFTVFLSITGSTLVLLGTIYDYFIFLVLNHNIKSGLYFILSITKLDYINYIDNILICIIPALLISIYSFNARSFKQSFLRSSVSSVCLFLMVDILLFLFAKYPSSPLRQLLLGLFHDIIGGIIFGFLIAIILYYYKRLLTDITFDKNVTVIKYYKLIFTISLASIFIYFLFFYRTYEAFSLILNDYDLFKFQFYSENVDKNIKVLIPTSGIYFGHKGDSPFKQIFKRCLGRNRNLRGCNRGVKKDVFR